MTTTLLAHGVIRALLLLGAIAVLYPPLAWLVRWSHVQPGQRARLASNPLQPIAAALKLLQKRAALPAGADPWLHRIAPLLAIVPVVLALAMIPPAAPLATADGRFALDVAAGFGTLPALLALYAVAPVGILLAGFSSHDPLTHLGGLRLVVIRASGAVVIALSTVGVARGHGTLELATLLERQGRVLVDVIPAWGVFKSPIAFFVALVAVALLAQRTLTGSRDRHPDLVEVHAAKAAGPILLAHRTFEVVDLLLSSALLAALFFGGYRLPGGLLESPDGVSAMRVAAGAGVFAIKTILLAGAILALRRALPPLRHDQALRALWLVLAPLALLALLVPTFLVP